MPSVPLEDIHRVTKDPSHLPAFDQRRPCLGIEHPDPHPLPPINLVVRKIVLGNVPRELSVPFTIDIILLGFF